ncbi:class I SAM-dependent methyltransferase [Candidiatus Paracoxiella cheracis]|uniref:class I SAM-dependent methyltransferase n=1 Tax=Candidiatus Paracoxiella cheracis TaxID=3405120 RepID=UPI003BF47114
MSNRKIKNYDKIAKNYLAVVDEKPIHKYYERPNLLSLVSEDLTGLAVLDVGCGSGWYAGELLKRGAKVTAIDNCQEMLDHTRERYGDRVDIKFCDVEKSLDMFHSEQFDSIIAPLIIHYVEDWSHLFKEFSRILKKGGRISFSTHQPQMEAMLAKLDSYYHKQIMQDTWSDIGKVSWYHHTLSDLFNSLICSGLMLEKVLEPLPNSELKAADPIMYEKISIYPWFIFIKAIKLAED